MAIEARENATPKTQEFNPETAKNVEEITVAMILQDLADGHGREAIRNIYSYKDPVSGEVKPLEAWMVTEMFKDPNLKGKKPSKKRALPFRFVGTPVTEAPLAADVPDTAEPATDQTNDIISVD